MSKRNQPISKAPYRALAASMKEINELSRMMTQTFPPSTDPFFDPITIEQYNREMEVSKKKETERTNKLICFFFGGEYQKRDGTTMRVTAGIKTFKPKIYDFDIPKEEIIVECKSTILERLYIILGLQNDEISLRKFSSNNPYAVIKKMKQIHELCEYYESWVKTNGGYIYK